MKIFNKLIIMSAGISLLCILTLSTVVYFYSQMMLADRATEQIHTVVMLKGSQIDRYVSRAYVNIQDMASQEELIAYLELMRARSSNSSSNNTLQESSDKYSGNISTMLFEDARGASFSEIMILTPDGIVALSTDESKNGINLSEETYFSDAKQEISVTNFYYLQAHDTKMAIAAPIMDHDNTVIGIIVGTINSDDVFNMVEERPRLGNSGEIILVNSKSELISKSRFRLWRDHDKVESSTISECLKGKSGNGTYTDHRGVKVIGVYHWIPEMDSCIIASMDADEVFKPLNNLLIAMILYGLAVLGAAFAITLFLSRSITHPLEELARGTKELSNGNFKHKVNIGDDEGNDDEIHMLAATLNAAGEALSHAQDLEKSYSKNLEEQLNAKTSEMKKNLEEIESSKKAALNIMEDLSEINIHLKELDQAKTDFLNIASHELKTPLTAISAYLEILDDYKGQFNEQQLQGLDAIKRNSNQLKTLINNILEISRLESNRFELNISEIDLEEKTKTIIENLRIISDAKGIELKYSIEGIKSISTDALRFEEILNNLVGNAIKFTDKGTVSVDAKPGSGEEAGFVVFRVIDTGVGIPENKMPNLFKNFYQVDSGISRKYGGTGLGLAITRRMIELQGGKISVESKLGEGTTFRFILPIKMIKKDLADTN